MSYSTSLHFLQIILLSSVYLQHKYFPRLKQILQFFTWPVFCSNKSELVDSFIAFITI